MKPDACIVVIVVKQCLFCRKWQNTDWLASKPMCMTVYWLAFLCMTGFEKISQSVFLWLKNVKNPTTTHRVKSQYSPSSVLTSNHHIAGAGVEGSFFFMSLIIISSGLL